LASVALAGDHMSSPRDTTRINLPALVLWAWDRDDDLRFIDTRDTAVAYLAATVILRGDGVFLAPRHNPLQLPDGTVRVAVAHVESDRAEPAVLNAAQMRRFIDVLAALGSSARRWPRSAPFSSRRSPGCADACPMPPSPSRRSPPGVSPKAGPDDWRRTRWCRCCSAWAPTAARCGSIS
jgi:hypothetical protein